MIVTDLRTSYNPVQKNKKEHVEKIDKFKVIKKKSNKLAKLEKERYSILTNNLEICYICKTKKEDLHEIYGGRNRKISIKNGFVVPLCRKCHQNNEILQKLQRELQKKYEKTHTREEFIKLIGKNYLD